MKTYYTISILTILHFCFAASSKAAKHERLYINKGDLITVDRKAIPFLAFNNTRTFSQINACLVLNIGDTLKLTVINNTNYSHGFAILNLSKHSVSISPQDSAMETFVFDKEQSYILYDPTQSPDNRYLGLATLITIENQVSKHKSFYWNLKEHQAVYNREIANHKIIDWKKYSPDYFTINSHSYPETQYDSTSKVVANVGDTVLLYIANTGQAKHILHFHGFHLKIIYSSEKNLPKNALKDTFSLESMQTIVLEMIADKRGQYSVHNQNLLAMSGGGIYPYGMLLIMQIND